MVSIKRTGALLAAVGLVGVLAGTSSAATTPHAAKVTLILYNGQHQQTADALVHGFEAANPNITVNVRSDDEDTLADQIVQEGSRSPADVFYTENAPALAYLDQRGLLSNVERRDAREDTGEVQRDRRRLVGRLGSRERDPLQPVLDQEGAAADGRAPDGTSEVQGQARDRGRRDRLSADRHRGRSRVWQEEDARVVVGHQGERRRRSHLPGQRDHRRRGQPRAGRVRHRQPVLLVSDAGRDRSIEHALCDRLLRAARPRIRDRRLRCRRAQVVQASAGRAGTSRLSRVQGRSGNHRHAVQVDQLRVPDRFRRHHQGARNRLRQAAAVFDHDERARHGETAISLLRQEQLL